MTSTLILYKTLITPERNFIVEDIDRYLLNQPKRTIFQFQYQRHMLQKEIKINYSQELASPVDELTYNYCSIQNEDDSYPVYYFILKRTQKSESTIQLDLLLDVANTFKFGIDYNFTSRSRIEREHKDRFSQYISSASVLIRKIDLYSEGISPSLYKKDDDYILNGLKWSLVYESETSEAAYNLNPVRCYLVPENEYTLTNHPPYILNFSELTLNYAYYFSSADNLNGTILYTRSSDSALVPYRLTRDKALVIFKRRLTDLNTIYNYIVEITYNPDGTFKESRYLDLAPTSLGISIIGGSIIHLDRNGIQSEVISPDNYIEPKYSISEVLDLPIYATFEAGDGEDVTLTTYAEIDKTNAKLIKIIKLPYAPVEIGTSIPSGWGFDLTTKRLILTDPDVSFNCYHDFRASNGGFEEFIFYPRAISANSLRDDEAESKLFHSDFYLKKFVYDSFSFNFILERMNPEAVIEEENFTFKFTTTKTINSKFMFTFETYDLGDYGNSDYYNILLINRNNEATIYNNAYADYIRNGYNYDVKTKDRNATAAWLGVTLNGIGTAASLISAPATGGLSLVSAVSMGTNTIQGIYNAITGTAQAEQNLQAKMASLMNQSTNVVGSDDLDLMEEYSGNNAKIVVYELSPKMKQNIADLFYYTGYISNEMKIPEVNTRYWFNYLQADPEIIPVKNMSLSMIDELSKRFKEGITFLHNHGNSWDFLQVKENWESWIIDLIS